MLFNDFTKNLPTCMQRHRFDINFGRDMNKKTIFLSGSYVKVESFHFMVRLLFKEQTAFFFKNVNMVISLLFNKYFVFVAKPAKSTRSFFAKTSKSTSSK